MFNRFLVAVGCFIFAVPTYAKECWALTNLKGHMASSTEKYRFIVDEYSNPMVLCFNDNGTGTVTGDDTQFVMFGTSTLVGWAQNE